VAIAALVWVCFRSADQVAGWLGGSARRSLSRLMAFLLLCIGVQILITGIQDVLGPLLARH
jgi:multiple antibiotic resistance protein